MEDNSAQCPKCGTPKNTGTECASCGVIYAKVKQKSCVKPAEIAEARKKEDAAAERMQTGEHLTGQESTSDFGILTPCNACGREISKNADACPNCGEPSKKEPPLVESKKKTDGGIGCAIIFIIIVAVALLSDINQKGTTRKTGDDYSTMAAIQCENYVKSTLKAPSTADFPFLDREIVSTKENTYIVKSYVDAQNSFGAQIRTHWICTIKYKGGDEADQYNWALINLTTNP